MRPELPSLAEEIITEIRRAIPEYARPIDGPYGQTLRRGVEQGLTAFVDRVADPAASHEGNGEICRRLGQYEAQEGRSMDCLQAAYRIGGQAAWRRIMKVAPRHGLSSLVMSRLAEALFVYLDELAALSLNGYLEAKADPAVALDERRRRLLRLILAGPSVPGRTLTELAVTAGWDLPGEVSMVAAQSGARYVRAAMDHDLLPDLDGAEPHLLLPGPLTTGRRAMLEAAIPGGRVAVGLTVPLPQAADSLRWARRALTLAGTGVIDESHLTLCEDHLVTLWLLSDAALTGRLSRRSLAALDELTPGRRDRLSETLRTWLVTRGTAAEMAGRLDVHPQTVRYRIRKLEQALGEQLEDPDARFGIEATLRAQWLREQMGTDGPSV
jgi:hypothetical protein